MTNEKQYSEKIAALIKQFLDEDEWKYTFYEEDGVFTFGELIDGAIKTIHYRVFVRQDDYIVNASVEIGADPKDAKLMANMAEFICRANDGLTGGKFEFDFEDGSIMAMSFTNCENIEPSGGNTFETEAIAACAMGGVSFSGGTGAVPGIFFGALLMGIINNSMNLMYIDSYWQQVVKGLIIIGSVLYSIYNSKTK